MDRPFLVVEQQGETVKVFVEVFSTKPHPVGLWEWDLEWNTNILQQGLIHVDSWGGSRTVCANTSELLQQLLSARPNLSLPSTRAFGVLARGYACNYNSPPLSKHRPPSSPHNCDEASNRTRAPRPINAAVTQRVSRRGV